MTNDDDTRVIATLRPSMPRMVVGIASLVVLGGFLLWVAVTSPPADLGWRTVLFAVAGLSFWGGFEMYRAAQEGLVLTRTALRTTSGEELFRVADVRRVERGALAFKPSGGFVVWLETRQPMGWAPGVWWRYGRMVGVGGITRSTEAKGMAEILDMVLSERVS
jgi:hypothetical protein